MAVKTKTERHSSQDTYVGHGSVIIRRGVGMIADVTGDDKSRKSLIVHRVHGVTHHAQDVKTRQDRLRQVHLHININTGMHSYYVLHDKIASVAVIYQYCYLKGYLKLLQCFDTVSWATGRASDL